MGERSTNEMEYPKRFELKNKKYKLIKVHKYHGLYEDENGMKRCFQPFDLGMIEQNTEAEKI